MNKMLLAPMGCVVLLHCKLDIRQIWDGHAIEVFYIKTSREHYQCYKIWVKSTRSIQVTDKVFFKHKYITMHKITKADAIVVATTQLTKVLQREILANIGKQDNMQLI